MNKLIGIIGGIGLGVATMYLLDPERGSQRRANLRQKAAGLGGAIPEKAKSMASQAQGLLEQVTSHLPGHLASTPHAPETDIASTVQNKMVQQPL
jgi:gas vesicle protein